MGEKDLCERELESYGDVFADILNALLFDGKNVVDPSCLEDRASRSTYLAGDGGVRGMERDVCKRWKMGDIRIACVGLENQSNKDHDMPLRVLAYEGTEYREQLLKENEGKPRYPVITLVLHFGEKRWCGPVCLKDVVNIPTELDPWVQDYKVNVINVAWLPP